MAWGEATPVWRTARKQFECAGDGCTRSIEPGDRYLDQTLRDLAHAHVRYCLTCGESVTRLAQDQLKFVGGRSGSDFADRYQQRIAGGAWKKLKAEVIELRGQSCQRCRQDKPGLALHHLHYRTLDHETPDDVELLCADCHEIADAQRRKHNSLSERMKRRTQAWASPSIAQDGEPANSPDAVGAKQAGPSDDPPVETGARGPIYR